MFTFFPYILLCMILGGAIGFFISLTMSSHLSDKKIEDAYRDGYLDGYKANQELYKMKGLKE